MAVIPIAKSRKLTEFQVRLRIRLSPTGYTGAFIGFGSRPTSPSDGLVFIELYHNKEI